MARRIKSINHQTGASLVEAMAALAVMAMVAASLSVWVYEQQRQERAMRTGAEMLSMWEAATRYTSKRYAQLVFSGGIAAISGASVFEELRPSLAGVATTPLNPYGQGYCLLLKQLANPARVEGLLLTTGGVAMDGGQQAVAIQSGGPGIGAVKLNGTSLEAKGALWTQALDAASRARIQSACGADVSSGGLGGFFSVMAPESAQSLLYRVPLTGSSGTPLTSLNTLSNDISVRGGLAAGAVATTAVACAAGTPGKNAAGELAECSGSDTWSVPAWAGAGYWSAAVRPGVAIPRLRQAATTLINTDCLVLGVVTRDTDGTVVGCQKPKGGTAQQWLRMGGKGIYVETLAEPRDLLDLLADPDGKIPQTKEIDIKNLAGLPKNVRLYTIKIAATAYCPAEPTSCTTQVFLVPKGTMLTSWPTVGSESGAFLTQLMIDATQPGYEALRVEWWLKGAAPAPYSRNKLEFKITGFVCEGDVCTY